MSRPFKPAGPPRYRHQRRGLRKLIDTGGTAALLFEPGLGKTGTVLDFASILALKAESDEARVLVVAPLAAVDTWVLQADTFIAEDVSYWAEALGGSLRERAEALSARGGQPMAQKKPTRRARPHAPRALHHRKSWAWKARDPRRERDLTPSEGPDGLTSPRLIIEVLNFDTFSSRQRVGSQTMADVMLDAVKRYQPDLVVVDESHKIKGATSNVSRLLGRLADHVPRRVILTGTVMPHSPMDVFGQWRFLDPYAYGTKLADGSRKRATFGQFRNRFAVQGGYMGREIVGFKNLDELQDIMAERAVVATKAESLDLPETTDTVVPVHLSKAEQDAYDDMRGALATQLISGSLATAPNRLSQMMRLRQITSGHLPDDHGRMHVLGTSKADTISSLVHDTLAGENRIVVFCQFTAEIALLRDKLDKSGTTVETIEGDTSSEDRQAIRRRFGDTERHPERIVLVAQITTLNMAVNELVTASHAIFGSLTQKRDEFIQARDRLHRIGQQRPVTYWYCLAPQTVDEIVMQAHQQRSDLERAMLQHIVGSDDLASIDAEETA